VHSGIRPYLGRAIGVLSSNSMPAPQGIRPAFPDHSPRAFDHPPRYVQSRPDSRPICGPEVSGSWNSTTSTEVVRVAALSLFYLRRTDVFRRQGYSHTTEALQGCKSKRTRRGGGIRLHARNKNHPARSAARKLTVPFLHARSARYFADNAPALRSMGASFRKHSRTECMETTTKGHPQSLGCPFVFFN